MKITFVGTGEASDGKRKNSSVLIEDTDHLHLLDCGFSSSHGYLQQKVSKQLCTIWVSHFHGDHFFGIVQLVVHFYMQARNKPLTIISGYKGNQKINALVELAYPGLLEKLPFDLDFIELQPGQRLEHDGLIWQSAPSNHSQDSFSLRVDDRHHSIYYSGDGKPTVEGQSLMNGCDLVIHEAFSLKPTLPAHSSIEECLQYAEKLQLKKLALIHINRKTWQQLNILDGPLTSPANTELFLPDDGDIIIL